MLERLRNFLLNRPKRMISMEKGNNPTGSKALNTGRTLVFILALSLAGIILYRYYQTDGGTTNYTKVPKEYQLNYLPANFKTNIDTEDALFILANPQRYKKEFDQLVHDLNMSILEHVSVRMGLSDALKAQVREEYETHHPYLRKLYYNDFIAMKDTTSNLYETWYKSETTNAVDILNTIASKYTCFLINQIMTTVVKTKDGAIFAKGANIDTPCGIALTEALQPLVKKMEERAAIEDFSRSKGLLQEKVERVIAELATMEVRDKKGINKQLQTKIWGVSVSSSDLEITAISLLKVGFRLNDYFNVSLNEKTGIVTVTLPEPVILSHEVYPQIDKLDIGWMRELKDVNFNESFNVLRREFRREALESDLMSKSKTQAIELMNTMFGPLISSINKKYKLKVAFKSAPKDEVDDPEFRELRK